MADKITWLLSARRLLATLRSTSCKMSCNICCSFSRFAPHWESVFETQLPCLTHILSPAHSHIVKLRAPIPLINAWRSFSDKFARTWLRGSCVAFSLTNPELERYYSLYNPWVKAHFSLGWRLLQTICFGRKNLTWRRLLNRNKNDDLKGNTFFSCSGIDGHQSFIVAIEHTCPIQAKQKSKNLTYILPNPLGFVARAHGSPPPPLPFCAICSRALQK